CGVTKTEVDVRVSVDVGDLGSEPALDVQRRSARPCEHPRHRNSEREPLLRACMKPLRLRMKIGEALLLDAQQRLNALLLGNDHRGVRAQVGLVQLVADAATMLLGSTLPLNVPNEFRSLIQTLMSSTSVWPWLKSNSSAMTGVRAAAAFGNPLVLMYSAFAAAGFVAMSSFAWFSAARNLATCAE